MPDIPIDFDRERAGLWRRDVVQARIRLAEDGLSPAERTELWRVVECREWCLKALAEDFAQELERIDREIEAKLRR